MSTLGQRDSSQFLKFTFYLLHFSFIAKYLLCYDFSNFRIEKFFFSNL